VWLLLLLLLLRGVHAVLLVLPPHAAAAAARGSPAWQRSDGCCMLPAWHMAPDFNG
jgi:hypothetical protein